ncbi:MAG: hypothetical protein COV10_02740 [Candidatus Vogelbacteria bacterium CG10_big_fil_rev_8_21_14_0_10_51_16]|uniref:Uncharacterized protein n=1 Tax=Candidatus Vogelbacteria bacterium CG10_big_fil_rev_8_21_14_0_10_51_16 TaxID=1975045 RepID=A0A2H0RE79_9BACT|nr:MAG: hypothetical protein COV10_02740 [Candidatus Vogelbacteria bacterium CG10_big_fil_rev_8_21_14_0_10_51_16]
MSQDKLNAIKLANIRKAMGDARRLREDMRFVILLEGGQVDSLFASTGCRIVENHRYVGNGIAVLGPALVHGVFMPDVLLCEISLSRGAPYATSEIGRNGARCYLSRRRRVRKLESEELHLVWPVVEDILEHVMTETRKGWTTQGPWYWRKGRKAERGVYAVVSDEDGLLHHKVLLEDLRYRRHKYLDRYVRAIRYWLRGYKRQYSDEQVRSYRGMQKVADLWGASRLSRLAREYIHSALVGREQQLLTRIISVCGLKHPIAELRAHCSVSSSSSILLSATERVWFYVRPKERTSHAKGCVVFEVVPRSSENGDNAKG